MASAPTPTVAPRRYRPRSYTNDLEEIVEDHLEEMLRVWDGSGGPWDEPGARVPICGPWDEPGARVPICYLQQAVFDPLEMVDTGFSVPEAQRDRLASCHTPRDGKLEIVDKAASSEFNDGFEFLSGGGGLVSTLGDYAKFCQMFVDGGEFRGQRLLRRETLELMFTDQLNGIAGEFRFGLGFAINEVELGMGERARKALQYSWGGYASTDFRIVPEERLVQVFLRQRVPSSHELANELFGIVYAGVGSD